MLLAFGAHAQTSSDFYKGKQIRMIIGHPAGNDYDLAGRFLARYLGKHIPGEPTIVVQNMPAAASIAAANFLYAQAPRDGTVFGSFSRNVPSQARMGQANVSADPRLFNLWGEAVDTARTMASSALPGAIQASEAAYLRLRHSFLFRLRGSFYRPLAGTAQSFILAGRL